MEHTAHSSAAIGERGAEGGGGDFNSHGRWIACRSKFMFKFGVKLFYVPDAVKRKNEHFMELELAEMGVWIDFMFNIPIKTKPNACRKKNSLIFFCFPVQ